MDAPRDFSLTEIEIRNLQQSIEQARAIVHRENAERPASFLFSLFSFLFRYLGIER